MPQIPALREALVSSPWKKGDVLVLFGELFARGYANGLVEEAERRGLTVVRATVGRREKDGTLRPLTAEETANIPQPFINVPLEAGFDLEPDSQGRAPIDFLRDVKLSEWESATLDFDALEDSRRRAVERFRKNTSAFLAQLKPLIPAGANVLFAHLMAGGVPRTKIVMPLVNRVVKGTGDRYLPSEKMWNSPIGRFCSMNFFEVTAETYRHLLELSAPLRTEIESKGGHVSYLAYGYHGTEILIGDKFQWQTYTPYIQGWAKMRLEAISAEFKDQGVNTCVYNCPEILTNSSNIFQGVEVSLYPMVEAFRRQAPGAAFTRKILGDCAALLNDGDAAFPRIHAMTDAYYANPVIQDRCRFEEWPQHTVQAQLETMLKASDALIALHKSDKALITGVLSEAVFHGCGRLMFNDSWAPKNPFAWIGHEVLVAALTKAE